MEATDAFTQVLSGHRHCVVHLSGGRVHARDLRAALRKQQGR